MEERYYDSSSDDIPEKDVEQDPPPAAQLRRKSLPAPTLLLAAIGASLVVVVMITVWFWERPQGQPPAKRIQLLEQRIEQLEDRIAKLGGADERVMALESQAQKFMTAADRFDRFETAVTMRMDAIAKELSGLQQAATAKTATGGQPAERGTATGQAAKSPKAPRPSAEEPLLHTVSAGETLYSISRRYGIGVDELRRANQLQKEATIYPGQQLKIR